MSSIDSPKPLLIRVKRKANEEKSTPNKRCKFVGTIDSPKSEDIYQLVAKTQTLPQMITDVNEIIEIQDFDDWNLKKNKTKEIITCNGQPLDSLDNRLEDSFEYIYDIYFLENKQLLDIENPVEYREYEDSEEDSNDENYIYNDYPDDNEVSEDVIDYYNYTDDHNDSQIDLRDNFESNNRISSDYELSDEDIDPINKYFLKNRDSDNSDSEEY